MLGPTAAGKSALGLELAQRLDGEIVACDSLQVYLGMDIGTGKPTREERRLRPHHLLDLVRPDEPFHAARWAALAATAITRIAARGRLPIVVGGTGLYYRALTVGLFEAPPPDETIRERHRDEAARLGTEALHLRLGSIDAATASTISPRDLVRISRALEVYEQTGVTVTDLKARQQRPSRWRPYAVVLEPPLPDLRGRIERRVEGMMSAGFLDEVRALRAAGFGPSARPMQALGYKQLGEHLDGTATLEAAVSATVGATVAYARRQRTWFRKEIAAARVEGEPAIGDLVSAFGELRTA
ncbi:MAG TPA: tRNA (adenosine(37)-N6)-dimethylallyltransferase MiaA [Polyangia bacterium]|nr:tRNA (adenosine(37)-N6)-dimethylallyltransferase MiaA [Polyangia bacterium]